MDNITGQYKCSRKERQINRRIDLSRIKIEQAETYISLGLRCFLMMNIASLTGNIDKQALSETVGKDMDKEL